ncbi:unnamed protein product [Ceutorhynchus assimilis]|uniref:Gamma-interferon-inducible lysosomal thiol reductase n=1 Tax=Ceutorhynchus assimilis TaxID=467358 RepID=A0A9N9MTA9_9CUCU|nr:unnamed protein product [Ceutorhynchus assimilis]
MNNLFKSLVLCIVVVSIKASMPVTVYYEALCGDSVHFITRQLYPNYQFVKDKITLDFVPYGKALHTYNSTTDHYTFTCQHGKEECLGNKYQACGLAQIDNPDTKLEFVVCVMSAYNPGKLEYVKACAERYQVDYHKLVSCALSREGDKLLAAHGDRTQELEPNLYFVPTLVLNNSIVINSDDQDESRQDFMGFLCTRLPHKPDICNDNTSLFKKVKNFLF